MLALKQPRFVRFGTDGAVAVEFAILAWPVVLLLVGILQLTLYQYTQIQLSNALFDSAADPELSILTNDATGYKAVVCGRIKTVPLATCKATIIVQMSRLSDVSTTTAPIQATPFTSGASHDVVLLRAGLATPRILPFMSIMSAKASVVFRRA